MSATAETIPSIDFWHWHPDPGVIDGVVALSVLYALACGPGRRWLKVDEALSSWKIGAFAIAQVLLFLAVASPLDTISEQYLFSAHMLQHVVLIYPVAFLWLWGMPAWLVRVFFTMEWSAPVMRFVTRPLVAFAIFNGLFYVWHIPALYEWALRDSKIHFLEHATFLGGALLLWWPLIQPLPEAPRVHPGAQLLYLLGGSIAQIPLFGILVFSSNVLYPTYRNAPRLTYLDPLADQQAGALLMKLTAMVVMFVSMAYIFLRWYNQEERRPRRAKRPA